MTLKAPALAHLALVLLVAFTTGCGLFKPPAPPPVDEASVVWPPPPETARVRWIEHIATSEYAAPPSMIVRFFANIAGTRDVYNFKKPYDVASDSQGRVFVTDTGWNAVMMFDKTNRKFDFWGQSGDGMLNKPSGITVDGRDHVFVSDLILKRIFEYDANGRFVRTIGADILKQPVGLAVDEERQRIYCVDSRVHGVVVFGMDGQHIATYGTRGGGDGEFNYPTNVAYNPKSHELYVTDTFNFRVQVIDRDGKFVRKWGKNCDSFGCFARAKGISIDADGHVYVVDAAFNNVQVFDSTGQLLLFFGGIGNGPGRMWLPAGIHVDNGGRIYVVSQYNWKVNVYQYLGDDGVEAPPTDAASEVPVGG